MWRNIFLKSIEIDKKSKKLSMDTTGKTSALKEKAVTTVMLVLEEWIANQPQVKKQT